MLLFHTSFLALVCGILAIRDYGPQTFDRNDGGRQSQPVQYADSDGPRAPPPAILTHKQGLTNDGVFNFVFAADNGLKQGESIAPDGTRTGAYEYIDPSGKTIFVKYMAGKDGFKILEGDHIPLQPQQVKPIPEYQPPEYREDYKQQKQQQPVNGKYRTETEDFDNRQFQQQNRQNQQYQQPRQQNPPNQRYVTPQKPTQLFQASQNKGFGNAGRQNTNNENKSTLYNVEQRHTPNYRRYQDNGQPIGGSDNQEAGHSFGGGYNFEFKG